MTSQIKERPILFSAPMVRAILEGRKTQTRRIVKSAFLEFGGAAGKDSPEWNDPTQWGYEHEDGRWSMLKTSQTDDYQIPCPYGQPGDHLWVRETWKTGKSLDEYSPKKIEESATEAGYGFDKDHTAAPVWYLADGKHRSWGDHDEEDFLGIGKTRVSIHMPRWASRITLEITNIRVERLNAITEDDALAEGIEPTLMNDATTRFINLWTSINGDGSWDANPFVWVIEFKGGAK